MKKLLSLLASVFFVISLSAADLIVEEFGTLPTYSSINAAITAAVNGDRIIIKNRAGDIPWIENFTVNKSLTFLSYTNNVQWIMQGTITIERATNREVNIIGMKNTSGNILEGTGTSSTRGTKVSIMDSWMVNGYIDLDHAAYDLQIVGNKLDAGFLNIYYGNVIGNEIVYASGPAVNLNVGSVTFTSDTCYIVGNKLTSNSSNSASLYINSAAQVYHVKNNLIQHRGYGIDFRLGNNNSVPNYITNNTIISTYASTVFGIALQTTNPSSVVEVMNNVFEESTTSSGSYGVYWSSGSGQVNVYYNVFETAIDFELNGGNTFTFSGNNTIQAITLNADGTLPAGSPAINGGNPAQQYYDLDLTVSDAGAYGGSYTLNNFFPLFTGAARLYFVKFPFNIRQGSTLSVKAYGYDR
ncbi:MAG: hypothetical protein JNM00_03275 [Flavobacteriales bacterium]|nr:hypothetical protein [Flavobacteriales bacterium]